MAEQTLKLVERRGFIVASAGGLIALAAPSVLRAQEAEIVRNNISSFRIHA